MACAVQSGQSRAHSNLQGMHCQEALVSEPRGVLPWKGRVGAALESDDEGDEVVELLAGLL